MSASLLLVAVVGVVISALCRRYGLSSPLILVVVGLLVSFIPGSPEVHLEPELVLFLILPPLLYSAAQDSSYHDIRANKRAIGMLAIGLPLFSTLVVGLVAYWTVPHLPLAAALVFGAIVAPPDAVSAQAIGRKVGLPRRIMTLLGGESLLNDATALTAFRVALAAAVGATATWWNGLSTFAIAAVGGVAIGLIVGYAVSVLRTWLTDPTMETALGLLVSFGTYYIAEEVHASGVIAVVVAGLFLGQRSVRDGYETRLQDDAVRRSIDAILESFVFLLIGLQLPFLVDGLAGESWVRVALDGAAVLVAVIVVRFVWVYPATYLSRLLPGVRRREPRPDPRAVFVLGWAGMRGVVSLAAAFAIPLTTEDGAPFPARAEVLFLTFVVVVGTLLLQGTSLPWVVRKLGVAADDASANRLAYAGAQDRAARASQQRLDELLADLPDDDHTRRHQVMMLRKWVDSQRNLAWEELGRGADDIGESPTAAHSRMRMEVLAVQRAVFIAERDAGRIDDEVLRTALRRLDFAEGQMDQVRE